MSRMSSFLVVLFCCLVTAQSKCYPTPRGKLPEGCRVGNLTVTADYSYEIINHLRCNNSTGESFFNTSPRNVSFHYMMGSIAPAYLLAAVDATSKNLVWMVSNLTVGTQYRIYPSNGRNTREVMPYKKPQLNQYSPQHVIEYLIFEEYRDYPSRMYTYSPHLHDTPFNLSTWINSQLNSGITICGPVAGGSAVAYQSSPAPAPAPNAGSNTISHTSKPNPADFHHHRKGNNSNRNVFDGVLLAGLILIGATFGF